MAEDIVIVVRDNLVRDVYSEDGRGFVVVDFDVEADEPYVCRMPGWTRENLPDDVVELFRRRGLAGFRRQKEPQTSVLKVGDRVRVVGRDHLWENQGPEMGTTGTVCQIAPTLPDVVGSIYPYAVEFDDAFPDGHDCGGYAQDGRGWYCADRHLERVEEEALSSEQVSLDEAFVEFRQETVEWIQALEETVRGARLKADAADAQAKAQAMAFAEFERRWGARIDAWSKGILDLERKVAEALDRITEVREAARIHTQALEVHVEALAKRVRVLEGGLEGGGS